MKMSYGWIVIGIFLSSFLVDIRAQEPIPKVTGSYKATGEMVETIDDDTDFKLQIAFEEGYDSESKDAVFRLWIEGASFTYVENYKSGQTFATSEETGCQEVTVEEWVRTKSPPVLLNYEDTNGTVRFSLKQLFSLDDKYLKVKALPTTFRGVAAKMWQYEIYGTEPGTNELRVIDVNAYWSDDSWNTTSEQKSVPLGYIVHKIDYRSNETGDVLHEQFINVYGFVQGAVDRKLFEPVQGIICPNKTQTLKFPDVSNVQALSFHSEVLFPDYQQIKYVDTWLDPQSKLLRMDMERLKDQVPIYEEKSRKYQSEMILGKLGIAYRLAYFKGSLTCSIVPIKDFDFDIQNLINFKEDIKDWSVGKLFGLNQTSYVYIGKTTKRDIPCHLFQGKRTDWPEPSAKVESLWEWCFSTSDVSKDNTVIFKNGEYGLISAQVKILKTNLQGDYPSNFRIIYNFYDVNSEDPKLIDATNFDISSCFQEEEKRHLQFAVTYQGLIVGESSEDMENLTSDIRFLLSFKNAIYQHSGIDPGSLRIANVKATVENKKLFLKFSILAPHKDLPQEIKKKEISTADAENKLKQIIDNNQFFINYIMNPGKEVQFHAISRSLRPQLNNTFIPHVLPDTTPISSSPTTAFTLNTDDDNTETYSILTSTKKDGWSSSTTNGKSTSPGTLTSSTKVPTPSPIREILDGKKTLHKAGAIAGVSIAMLIVGMSIGSTIIFISFKGLPQCLKCAGISSS